MQYPVICAVLLHLSHRNSVSSYLAIVVEGRQKKERRSQKIDDLLVLASCWSGTLVMLSSNVNGPVAHGSTR